MSHEHHIIPFQTLLKTAGGLVVLTIITVALPALVTIPAPWNVVVALAIALCKASLVVMFFMSLYWDNKFNTLVFLSSVLFFIAMVGITMIDTMFRDDVTPGF